MDGPQEEGDERRAGAQGEGRPEAGARAPAAPRPTSVPTRALAARRMPGASFDQRRVRTPPSWKPITAASRGQSMRAEDLPSSGPGMVAIPMVTRIETIDMARATRDSRLLVFAPVARGTARGVPILRRRRGATSGRIERPGGGRTSGGGRGPRSDDAG